LQVPRKPLPGAGRAVAGRELCSARNRIPARGWWLGVGQFGCAALGPELLRVSALGATLSQVCCITVLLGGSSPAELMDFKRLLRSG